jgi:iron uptake system component EfeO
MSLPVPSQTQRLLALFAVIGVIIAAGITGTVLSRAQPQASSRGVIRVESGTETCGQGWTDSHGGLLNFAVHNTTIAGEEVYLQGAKSGLLYGELEGLGAGATHNLSVILGDGSYRFVCLPSDLSVQLGPTVTVSGAGQPSDRTPGIAIVTNADLIEPSKQYHAWIDGRLPILAADVQALEDAVASGNVTVAKSAWLTAHLEYESLGAAYGAFGESNGAINGSPASGTTALNDPNLTGFHRIEAQLWSGVPPPQILPYASQLVRDVTTLRTTFTTAQIPTLDVGLRAHEILENAIQFELTASTDAGSGTNIATISANLVGTREALAPLLPLLKTRFPGLSSTEQWLDRSTALVAGYHHADGSWSPVERLSTTERQTLNSTLDQTVELLASVATITDPRTPEQ